MATEKTFNGRLITIPGAYAKTESGVNNPPLDFSYGNVLVIDKDASNPFGGGAGIAGELVSGDKAVYPFDNLLDFQNFIKGGELYDNAIPMFRPSGPGTNGVSKIYYVRALETTGATHTLTFTGGGSDGGALNFKTRIEGLAGNGVEGDETRASQTVEITLVGASSDTIDVVANGVTLGTYTSNGTDTPSVAAATLANEINTGTSGYLAEVSGATLTIYAPVNLGTTANGYSFASNVTGSATSTVGAATMTGGADGTTITRGMGITMEAGVVNPSKFILKFWRGTFTGLDSEGHAYNGLSESVTNPQLLTQTPEFDNVQEVVDWASSNVAFANYFTLTSSTVSGSGAVDAADLAATTGNQLFTGGTQVYDTARIDQILDVVKPLDYTFVYTLDSGAQAQSVDNTKILSNLVSQAKYEKFLVIGGGDDTNTFASQSIASAQYFNSDRVILCHGGCNVTFQESGTGLKQKSARYKAAHVLGRMCGLSPQTPITFKILGYASEVHDLSDSEKEQALSAGVLVTGYDHELTAYTIIAGVNTLQRNTYVLNPDGTSHLISLKRIAAQLNKELEINAKVQLLGKQNVGANRATLSPSIVKNWVQEFLKRKTATATEDNLILRFQDITAEYSQDTLHVRYSFVPNFEISKLFITGIIIDPSLN